MENKKITLRNLKGTFDFLPSEQIVRNKIIDIIKSNFSLYGYLPIETPILNEFDLLKYKYKDGAEILNEIYRLSDQGKRDIGLRYDLTIPLCKVIGINKDLAMPFRRYEIGRVFRDGPVKAGRAREFYQCDADVVGIDGRYIEVEQMQMVLSVFNQLGIDVVIKWNNRKLMTGLVEVLGLSSKTDEVIGLIDRLEKISKEELFEEFEKIGVEKAKVQELLDLFSKTFEEYQSIFENTENEDIKRGLAEGEEIIKLSTQIGIDKNLFFSPTLARGLGIYTGTVFEFFDKEKRITSSLGGGGRYDEIITNFIDNGQKYPAVGLSFGLEPIFFILSQEQEKSFVDVLIVPMQTENICMQLAERLRKIGIKTIVDFNGKRVKKSFEFANKNNIKYVMVVGENEVESKLYSIKDMQSGEQISAKIEEIENMLKQNIGE